jgi:hypothetical protein
MGGLLSRTIARLAAPPMAAAVIPPPGEEPNQPMSLVETPAVSGSAEKFTRISRLHRDVTRQELVSMFPDRRLLQAG